MAIPSEIIWLIAATIPVGLTLWALLDAARRPAWAWSFAEKSQLGWITAIVFGVFMVGLGALIAIFYLLRVRPQIEAIERGDFGPSV